MKTTLSCLLLLAGFVTVCQSAEEGASICSIRYYNILAEAIRIKTTCETAAFYDCCQIVNFLPDAVTGFYEISGTAVGPFSATKLFARCDMTNADGGWTVFQRRITNGTVDFNRKWDDYEIGFGDLEGEFWMGLQNIHRLTTRDAVELRIDLQDEEGNNVTWTYQTFRVDGPALNYRVHIGGSTRAPPGIQNALAQSNNQYFSTYDKYNVGGTNYAQRYFGGWWYYQNNNYVNLNGRHDATAAGAGITWRNGYQWLTYTNVEMKMRPKNCLVKDLRCISD